MQKNFQQSGFLLIALGLFFTINTKAQRPNNTVTEIIFRGDFNDDFGSENWKKNWGIEWLQGTERCSIEYDEKLRKSVLKVAYPQKGVGPGKSGAQFPLVFKNLPGNTAEHFQELYLRYDLQFEPGFDFRLGGKLPGLMGGGDSWSRSGGDQPDGSNGWTLRLMWRKQGQLVVYAYLPKSSNGNYGSETWGQDLDLDFSATAGEWICIEQYVNTGTPGNDDGSLKVWINGNLQLNRNDICFRYTANNNGLIGGCYFSTFHGGNTPDWGPLHTSQARFSDFLIAKTPLNCNQE